MSNKQKTPKLPEVPLLWWSEINAARNRWTTQPLTIFIGPARLPAPYCSQAGAILYPPRLVNWIVFMLDQAERVEEVHTHALEVRLFRKDAEPYVFGIFNGHSQACAMLLYGLNAYYRRVYKQAQRDLRLAQKAASMVFISAQLCKVKVKAAEVKKTWRSPAGL